MRRSHVFLPAVSASTLTLSACSPFHRGPVTPVRTGANVTGRWRASLVTPADLVGALHIRGTATMEPGRNSGETNRPIKIRNSTPDRASVAGASQAVRSE